MLTSSIFLLWQGSLFSFPRKDVSTSTQNQPFNAITLSFKEAPGAHFSPRPESGGFRFRSAPQLPARSAPQNRRTHAAPDSSLSLSLKTLPFRWRSTPGLSG
jgi:hypothetical protein